MEIAVNHLAEATVVATVVPAEANHLVVTQTVPLWVAECSQDFLNLVEEAMALVEVKD